MKRSRVIIIAAVAVGIIVMILLNNRSKINAKSRNDFATAVPVTVTEVKAQRVEENLSRVGTITANTDVAVVAEVAGKVMAVYAQVGDFKTAGSPLIQLDDEVKKATFEQAKAAYERAKLDYARFTSLLQEQAATAVQKENAYTGLKAAEAQYIVAKRQLQDTRVSTPISGIVSARTVDVGTMVNDRMVVANVVDISTLKVKLNVGERDAFRLKAGDPVEITTEVYPGVTFSGRIKSISAKGDESHTYPVEITMDNSKQHPLRAGMFGRVSFVSIGQSDALVIPREALVGSMKDARVYVIEKDLARERSIVVGSQTGTELTVLSGLAAGEKVVVNGQNNLKDSVTVDILQ